MMNYYDEIKNDILEAIEEDENVKEILYSGDCKDTIFENLYDYLFDCDYVTGNGSGSYYFNNWEARQQCYNFASDVKEALEGYEYGGKLELFKIFESLADEGYLNVDTMKISDDISEEEEEDTYYYLEEIEGLDFEILDVITRCYFLNEVLSDVLDEKL